MQLHGLAYGFEDDIKSLPLEDGVDGQMSSFMYLDGRERKFKRRKITWWLWVEDGGDDTDLPFGGRIYRLKLHFVGVQIKDTPNVSFIFILVFFLLLSLSSCHMCL
ncbi:hypothetical protein HanHA300_Chr14g0538931 [Helianthus annuus]|nr:hypothetical protein HanHA300_Chr14g0538931 [Helianthus annuus]KAJ0487100.1 hypothetical protein HanHA89_Chr14g0586711 [Helianthus annuus]